MTTHHEPAASKLLTRFDDLLKMILLEDIKSFRENVGKLTSNNQVTEQQLLSVA